MLKAVIFDLDGTLTNIAFDYKKAKAEVISFLVSSEVNEKLLDETKSIYINIEAAVSYITKKFGEERAKLIRKKAFEIVDSYERQEIGKTFLNEGALSLIQCIKSRGIKVAVCTNNSSYTSLSILKELNLLSLIDAIVTRDDSERLKPYPDPLLIVCNKLNISTSEALFVGDSIVDLLAAKAAGMKFVFLSKESLPQTKEIVNNFHFEKVSSLNEIKKIVGCVS
ncbi:MAG: HAD family hydrolase [Thermoproteota archaeon]